MAKYVDGFVVPIPKSKVDEYKKMAQLGKKLWLEHGALDYQELIADDVPYGKETSFPRAVNRKNSETVVFSWITYKSRAHRDKVNEKVMKDPRMTEGWDIENTPFDMSRMIYGGFKSLVST
jgi:uncharacterized protein YbaA (DUF1428 family)